MINSITINTITNIATIITKCIMIGDAHSYNRYYSYSNTNNNSSTNSNTPGLRYKIPVFSDPAPGKS